MPNLHFLTALILFIVIGIKAQELKSYSDFSNEDIFKIDGRTKLLPNAVELIGSASSVSFIASGKSVVINCKSATDAYGFIEVSLNGNYVDRYKISAARETEIEIDLKKDSSNHIQIFKATEAPNGGLLLTTINAEKLLTYNDTSSLEMEFIGDSITCGYGAATEEIPCGSGAEWYDQHTAYYAYGSRIARALNANYTLSSFSGMGMYRNWNDEDQFVMPDVYQTINLDGNEKDLWKPKKQPAIVSICLGTNDLSTGDGTKKRLPFSKEKFTKNYINFVRLVYKRYPKAKIVLLNSPMVSGEKNDILVSCLQEVKNSFEETHDIVIFQFKDINPKGCGSHPNIEDHEKMASQMIPKYKELLIRK